MRQQLAALTPTPAQLKYLRALASRGQFTFAWPVTRQQAAGEIVRLKAKRRRQRGTLQPPTVGGPALAASSWTPAWVARRAAARGGAHVLPTDHKPPVRSVTPDAAYARVGARLVPAGSWCPCSQHLLPPKPL